jgi:Fic family protein
MPLLIQNALLHSQLETIHPFLDATGDSGGCYSYSSSSPEAASPRELLYLSAYLERNRRSYYEALQTIHGTGDAIAWIELFLAAVHDPGHRCRGPCPAHH